MILEEVDWARRAALHRERAERWTVPARARRARGEPHPVEDFLFTYYSASFAQLEAWHPGAGVGLEVTGDVEGVFAKRPYCREAGLVRAVPEELTEKEAVRVRWIRDLLAATAGRAPNFGCYGLHEWAMVFRGEDVRHRESVPLRLSQREIDEVVSTRAICCSHFDAFRFFHPAARGLNRLQPTLEARRAMEQPGCVHANMDLYKWAMKTVVWAGADLMLECFELAVRLRELDMRASPYDLSAYGHEPVRIETADGRREYESMQRELAEEARGLRARLIGKLDAVVGLTAAGRAD